MAVYREIMNAIHEKLEGLDLEDKRIIVDLVYEALGRERRRLAYFEVGEERVRVGSKQFQILSFLTTTSQASMRDIREALEENAPAIKLSLDRLLAKGLVKRQDAPDSLRARFLFEIENEVKEALQGWKDNEGV